MWAKYFKTENSNSYFGDQDENRFLFLWNKEGIKTGHWFNLVIECLTTIDLKVFFDYRSLEGKNLQGSLYILEEGNKVYDSSEGEKIVKFEAGKSYRFSCGGSGADIVGGYMVKPSYKVETPKVTILDLLYFLFVTLVWQFPQTFISWVVLLFIRKHIVRKEKFRGKILYRMSHDFKGFPGVSFGETIFLKDRWESSSPGVKDHEYGHSIQSLILGPLYLLIVGISSATLHTIQKVQFEAFVKRNPSDSRAIALYRNKLINFYYSFFQEAWADRLGGVKRSSLPQT